jgi:hypothetical protein
MNRYYQILLRALGDPAAATAQFRRTVYEQAQAALLAEMASKRPPPTAVQIDREFRSLTSAIRRIEAETALATGEMSAVKLSISKQVVLSALAKGKPAPAPRAFPVVDPNLIEMLPS